MTQWPSSSSSLAEAMIAASTGVPIFTWIAELAGDLGEQQGHEPQGPVENGRERVRTGVGSDTENPQNRRNDPPLAADAKIPLSAVVAQHRVPSRSIQPARKLSGRSCAMLAHLKASEGAVSHLLVGPDAMMATNDVDGLRLTFDGWRVLHMRPSLKRAQMTCYVEAVKNWT
ncbi:hypothetical protein [Mesorhizobium sp. M0895]|uniref:hypothetical protein n=1 Tax=Mesorhizobium sp. M0895 TaxID=2957019 RepID=UPI00333C72E0